MVFRDSSVDLAEEEDQTEEEEVEEGEDKSVKDDVDNEADEADGRDDEEERSKEDELTELAAATVAEGVAEDVDVDEVVAWYAASRAPHSLLCRFQSAA